MSAADVLQQLRWFLLGLSVILFGGALAELWLVGHTEDWIQWIPFVLVTVGAIAALLVLILPGRTTVRILRICMMVIVLGTVFGIYEHMAGNIAFESEVHPKASRRRNVWRALHGGNPLLAPGILAIAAVLAMAATYRYEIKTDSAEGLTRS